MSKVKSTEELLQIAGATASKVLETETARSLPLATKSFLNLRIVVLYYRESVIPGEEIVYPPHYIMVLDARSGKIIRFEPCTPRDLGVNKREGVPEQGFGLDPNMSPDEFWGRIDRFLEISPIIWQAFDSGKRKFNPKTTGFIKEYYSIFWKILKKPLLPYYSAVAKDFLKWLENFSK
jgi:hypothetical protein